MNDESEIAKISSRFEAVKIAMNQDKNGHVLKLAIHPNDTPEDIMRDAVGARYMVVIVRMDDEGQPVASEQNRAGEFAVKVAGTLCGDSRFQTWLCTAGLTDNISEQSATEYVRKYVGVASRKELRTNSKARDKLLSLRDEFVAALRRG